MKKVIIKSVLIPLFLFSVRIEAPSQRKADEALFEEAKILIFDENWERAYLKLKELLEKYPQSPLAAQALFYCGKCLEEKGGAEERALGFYKQYLTHKEQSKSLSEESEISVIDLATKLYEKGKREYLEEVEKRLESSNRIVKYYAAFKLSYVKDKKRASKGIPVLKEIIRNEKDEELRDRARIALLRIRPEELKDIEGEEKRKGLILNIQLYKKSEKRVAFKLSIPWALADLALGSIPEREKNLIKEKGVDLKRIIEDLRRKKGTIISLEGEDAELKIWLE